MDQEVHRDGPSWITHKTRETPGLKPPRYSFPTRYSRNLDIRNKRYRKMRGGKREKGKGRKEEGEEKSQDTQSS